MAAYQNMTPRVILWLAGSMFMTCLAAHAAAPSLTGVYSFTGQSGDGAYPYTGVILGSNGSLYGTTEYGGAGNYGTVFQLTPPPGGTGPWTETVLYSFTYTSGAYPYAGVVMDSSGNLYGTTVYGGSGGLGTAFELTPPAAPGGAWTQTVLHHFTGGSDGANPYGGLTMGGSGVVYGTTELGGAGSVGTVFKLVPPGTSGGAWTESVLYSFTGGNDGAFPYGSLVIGKSSVLYGTTNFGGASIYGTVYQLTPPAAGGAWTETTLHSFTGNGDGGNPFSSLAIGSTGALYGTTAGGISAGYGTVFKLTPPGTPGGAWTESVLYRFSGGKDGGHPRGCLSIGKSGVLYGTAFAGGNANSYTGDGVLFQLTPPVSTGPWTETVLYTFPGGAGGAYPAASLAAAANGSYYGTTLVGGSAGRGTVFNLAP